MELDKMQEKCIEVAAIMKHFAHPQRLLILCFICDKEKQAGEIHNAVGLSQSQTSQYLKRMQGEGLIGLRREKNYSYYFVINPEVKKMLKSMQKIFCK